jgi:AraC-like DNA-binding protein
MKDVSGDFAAWLESAEAAQFPLLVTQYLWTAETVPTGHKHRRGQLAFSGEGVITVSTAGGRWVTPANRAVWVPPMVFHETSAAVGVKMHSVFLREDVAATLPQAVTAVAVSPLLRELIFHASDKPPATEVSAPDARLHAVLYDQLRTLQTLPLDLPMPTDKRLLRICKGILQDPASRLTLDEWGQRVGASKRTITHLFPAETQLTFDEWRKQAVLLEALARLAAGKSVGQVAIELNYESSSAFIAMFRKSLGSTPGKYFATGTAGQA